MLPEKMSKLNPKSLGERKSLKYEQKSMKCKIESQQRALMTLKDGYLKRLTKYI